MNKFTFFYLILFCLTFAGCSGANNNLNLTNLKIMDLENKSEGTTNCKPKENSLFGLSRTCENKGSFLEGIVNNPVSSKAINENVEAEMDTKLIDNCKLKANTLFGFSRTCDNSEMMSKSLTQ